MTVARYLFSRSEKKILEQFAKRRTLIAFDFDGTLSRIEKKPDQVTVDPAVAALLKRLEELTPVAVVSGRNRGNLARVLSSRPDYLIGNHGLESPGASPALVKRAASTCRSWMRQLVPVVKGLPGVELEDKRYSLSIHYRRSPKSRLRAKFEILAVCEKLQPRPHLILGKAVVNVIPQGSPGKGKALLALMRKEGFTHAIYIGDDDTDEDVFTLKEARSAKPRILGIRVGRRAESSARYFILRQSQINRVLSELVRLSHQR
ncbi:MAG: trehalose-phosphatase [Bdellovibrionales bacterium GWB1_55_8]|nr:MAG: trehalose-phosphatase [Bdellovibrionales bacterium GWB1_55_8]